MGQAAVTVLLIALNVAAWALIARAGWWLVVSVRRGSPRESP